MVDRVAREGVSAGRWLDVGFGNGSLLCTAHEYGFYPVGLDLRETSVAELSQIGIESHVSDIADYQSGDKFSVISLADVLEHMPFPKSGLQAARRLIKTDGVLFVSLPAMGCALWEFLDAQNINPYWVEIEHYHNFTRQRLYQLLEETGFKPVRYGISERYRACMEVIARPM